MAGAAGSVGVFGKLLAHKPSAKWIARGVEDPRKLNEYVRRATAELVRHTRALASEAKPAQRKRLKPSMRKF